MGGVQPISMLLFFVGNTPIPHQWWDDADHSSDKASRVEPKIQAFFSVFGWLLFFVERTVASFFDASAVCCCVVGSRVYPSLDAKLSSYGERIVLNSSLLLC